MYSVSLFARFLFTVLATGFLEMHMAGLLGPKLSFARAYPMRICLCGFTMLDTAYLQLLFLREALVNGVFWMSI